MPTTFKVQSKHHAQMYPEDLMIEHFGAVQPSASQRANKFTGFWQDWANNQIILPRGLTEHRVHQILQPHMKSLFEWQVRAGMAETTNPGQNITKHVTAGDPNHKYMKKALFVRFRSKELHALARILLS